MTKKKALAVGVATSGFLILLLAVTPTLYGNHATGELARRLDAEYGKSGWVAFWVESDMQGGEQINLYRTTYLKLLYPKLLGFTPYRRLEFTHKTGYSRVPPHYAVLVYSTAGEFAYRWSMKKDAWYIAYQNSSTILPAHSKERIASALSKIARVRGLNAVATCPLLGFQCFP